MLVKNTTGSGPLTGVVQIAAGKYHTCARISNGTVDCWGHNGYYELGDGTNNDHLPPTPWSTAPATASLTGQVNISIGQYDSCAVQSDGSARCWGLNQFGNLGDGTTKPERVPTQVKAVTGTGFLANVTAIAAAPVSTRVRS